MRLLGVLVVFAGIAFAAMAVWLALGHGWDAASVVDLPGMGYLIGAVLLILMVALIADGVKWSVRGRRRSGVTAPAAPESDRPPMVMALPYVAAHLSTMVALALIALAAAVAFPFDSDAAAGLFQAWLIVLISGAVAGLTLSAATRIERLFRSCLSRRRKISRART